MLSFFGDQTGQKTPNKTVVSKVSVTKTVSRQASSGVNGSSARLSTSGSSHSKAPTASSKASPIRPSSASSSASRPSASSTNRGSSSKLDVRPSLQAKSSPGGKSPALKRKTSAVTRVESESESSSSESSDDALDPKPKKKRLNGNGSGTGASTPIGGLEEPEVRDGVWCLDQVDMRGEWGRGWVGFVGSQEIVRGHVTGWAGGGGSGNGSGAEGKHVEKYQAYFPQPGFENGEQPPEVELVYPAPGCREKFILLTPTSHREYNPMSELRTALRLILEHYIPPSHAHIFGNLSDSLTEQVEGPSVVPSRLTSPLPGHLATPPPDPTIPIETIGDALRKALAPNRRDGPGFLRAMDRFNAAMEDIQKDGSMVAWMKSRASPKAREWSTLVDFVHDQAYSRVVGPYSNELEHHPKHPDEVARAISGKEDAYGELRHNLDRFMSKVIEQTGLGAEHTFVDLGSGVGNCVLQAALQAGCKSYGFELLPVPAHCARLQVREVQRRWAMWGLNGNLDVEAHEGDFRTHEVVAKRLREADVVLVNNEVFPSSLNIDLTHMFLDLKEGATIVSLKPFVPEGFRMNESNCDSFAAIVRSTQHSYYQDWVSWKGDSGKYYLQVIDRSKRAKFEVEMSKRSRR
ncbi:hypothetical protein IAU60_000476 [Kwoniella sp. DSM 27419]